MLMHPLTVMVLDPEALSNCSRVFTSQIGLVQVEAQNPENEEQHSSKTVTTKARRQILTSVAILAYLFLHRNFPGIPRVHPLFSDKGESAEKQIPPIY